jgi:hypothetical protein
MKTKKMKKYSHKTKKMNKEILNSKSLFFNKDITNMYDSISPLHNKLKDFLQNTQKKSSDPEILFLFKDGHVSENFLFIIDNFFDDSVIDKLKKNAVSIVSKLKTSSESLSKVGIIKTFRNGFGIYNNNILKSFRKKLLIQIEKYVPMFVVQKYKNVHKIWSYAGINNMLRFVYYTHNEGFVTHFDNTRWSGHKDGWVDNKTQNDPSKEDDGYHTFVTLNMYLENKIHYDKGLLDIIPVKHGKNTTIFNDDFKDINNKKSFTEQDLKKKYIISKKEGIRKIEPKKGSMLMFGQGRINGILHTPNKVLRHDKCMDDCDDKTKWLFRGDVSYKLIYDSSKLLIN